MQSLDSFTYVVHPMLYAYLENVIYSCMIMCDPWLKTDKMLASINF